MIWQVSVFSEAAGDIESGIDFYNALEAGVGDWFRDSIIADIRRLGFYFGTHRIQFGYHRMLASNFPYAIYYLEEENRRRVAAVLDLRRDPRSLASFLAGRA